MTVANIPPANPKRGLPREHFAIQFIQQFPAGSLLMMDDFDAWCEGQGLFTVPRGVSKKSDAWLAHLQRRHQVKAGLNRALNHPRMKVVGLEAASVERISHGRLEVRPAKDLILRNSMAKSIESLTGTHRRQLQYAMQVSGCASVDSQPASSTSATRGSSPLPAGPSPTSLAASSSQAPTRFSNLILRRSSSR